MEKTVSLKTVQRRTSGATVLLNVLGALVAQVYFSVIDPLPTGQNPLQSMEWSTILAFALVTLTALILGMVVGQRREKRIVEWYERLRAGAQPQDVPLQVRRDVLQSPLYSAGLTAGMWLLVGMFVTFAARWWRVFVGVVGVSGVLGTALLYFIYDLLWRPVVRVFFPLGQVSQVKARRMPVLGRLLIVFLLVGIYPPALLVNLTWPRALVLSTVDNPQVILDNLLFLQLFVLGVGALASIGLAVFMTRGLVGPLDRLQAAMKQVEQNNLDVQVPVTGNDELGYLGERFNQMVAGLRQGELLRNLLNLYVSPEVAREALAHGAQLGGKHVECTVIFSDIRGFTTISEQLDPETLINLLNRYMVAMVEVIVAQGGIVNKFGGDSVLAVFGTPLNPASDHAARALRAAQGMLAALVGFNKEQQARGEPILRIGVGVATGPVIAGNMGGHERIEYTVIGDTVNLASRLQDKTKELETAILCSESTHAHAAQHMPLQANRLPAVRVKGKREAVTVYAL